MTTLDVVRAEAFIGEILATDPREVSLPVVGGHAGVTILPLLSQARYGSLLAHAHVGERVVHRLLLGWVYPVANLHEIARR